MNLDANVALARDPINSTALDQWRGLALVFVLISHGFYFTGRVHGIGRVGVNLFFFISGVLVFRSLSSSRQATGLKLALNFWKRRGRRLYPALLAYVLAMIPIVYLFRNLPDAVTPDPAVFFRAVPGALLYLSNYWPFTPTSIGHLWSVACEMQFYLLSPCIFLLGGKSSRRRNSVWALLLLIALAGGFFGAVLDRTLVHRYHFEAAVWPMMLGFCCEFRKDLFAPFAAKWTRVVVRASLFIFALMMIVMVSGYEMKKPVIAIGAFAFIPCFLAYVSDRAWGGPIGAALTWIGERTYSIYLLQQPFTICGYLPVLWHPVGAILSIFAGGVWFRLFEQPFLSAKRQEVTART